MPNGIALDQNSVHCPLDICNEPLGGHQCGVHTKFDALGAAPGNAKQLDAVSELLGMTNVLRL